jgi:hypothetical protein
MVSRWENNHRTPGPYWRGYLAKALSVPVDLLHHDRVDRRTFLTAAALAPLAKSPMGQATSDIMSGIAVGDCAPLALIQTSHHTDLFLSSLVGRERGAIRRLTRWMWDDPSEVLRVNAAGIIAKLPGQELDELVVRCLVHDQAVQGRYLSAVEARVGSTITALAREAVNPNDAGARWCAAYLLGRKSCAGN